MNKQIRVLRPALIASLVGFGWGLSMTIKPYGTGYGAGYFAMSLMIGIVYAVAAFLIVFVSQGIRGYVTKPKTDQAQNKSKPGLFTAIESHDDALAAIKIASWLIVAMAAIAFAIRLFAGSVGLGIVDAVLVIGLAVTVLRLHSRAAAVLLLALALVSAFATGYNRFSGSIGGANLFMALLIAWASVRLVIATFQLNSHQISSPDAAQTIRTTPISAPTHTSSEQSPHSSREEPDAAHRGIEIGSVSGNMTTPDEKFWADALAEFESSSRRPGLWAKAFAEANGNEAAAKASYLRQRAGELRDEHRAYLAAQERAAKERSREAELARLTAEQRAYELLPKGRCPNCESVIPLQSEKCPKCHAIFTADAGWRVLPLEET